MNKVLLMGRLTRDPETRFGAGASGTAISRFAIAVDRRFKREGEPEADFFNCTAFGKQAEFVDKYLKKGVKVVVIGRIQNDNYTNKNGEKVYSVSIMVDEIEFAESKSAANSTAASSNQSPAQSQPAPNVAQQATNEGGFLDIPDGIVEDLPFN